MYGSQPTQERISLAFSVYLFRYASMWQRIFFLLLPEMVYGVIVEEVFNHQMRLMVLFPTHKNRQYTFVLLSACRHSTVTDNL